MYLLTASTVLLAVLVVLNMALTMAIIRRLRGIERDRSPDIGAGGLSVGAEVPDFEATALDGSVISGDTLAGRRTVFAFYSTSCDACEAQAPAFAQEADQLAAEGTQVVSVLMRTGEKSGDLRELLARAGTLVEEDGVGAVTTTFATRATPSYFAIGPDRRVTGKGLSLTECLAGGSP